MLLVALVDSPDHVCCRYRLRAFREQLAAAGHTLELRSWPRNWWGRLRLGTDLGHADAVIVQRKLLPPWQLRLLRRRVRRLIFDFDDAVFLRDSYSAKGMHSTDRWRRFAATVRAADAVVAGNAWLLERATAAGARQGFLIPTCVQPHCPFATSVRSDAICRVDAPADAINRVTTNRRCDQTSSCFSQAARRDTSVVRLVWIGSASTLQGLERARPLLEAIGEAVPGVRLKLICDQFLAFNHLPVEPCPWSEATEAAAIAAADIGISWLPDDDWSRGKCGLKVLQYMAAGLPVVANPVGVQTDLVRPGETGFLATTLDEWVAAVSRLANDADLCRRLGAAGRRRVEAEFSVTAGGRLWLDLLATLAGKQFHATEAA